MADDAGQVSIEQLLSHAGWVRGLAYSLVRSASEADELVQDAWLAALRSPPSRADNLKSWLRTVVTNRWRERFRSGKARAVRESAAAKKEAVDDGPALLARAEAQRNVVGFVTELDEPFRTAILMRYFDDLAPREIAERLGEPVETVYARLRKAQDLLRARMRGRFGAEWPLALVPLLQWPDPVEARPTDGTPGPTGSTARSPLIVGAAAAAVVIALFTTWSVWPSEHSDPSGAGSGATATTATTQDDRAAPARRARRGGATADAGTAAAESIDGTADAAAKSASPAARANDRVAIVGRISFDGSDDGPIVVRVLPWASDPRKVTFTESERTVSRGGFALDLPISPDGANRACEWELRVDDPRFLRVRKRVGYVRADGSVDASDLRLPRAASVTGKVTWKPVRGDDKAWIGVARIDDSRRSTLLDSVEALPGREFTLRTSTSEPTVLVAIAPGQMPTCRDVAPAAGQPANLGEIVLEPGASVSGRIDAACCIGPADHGITLTCQVVPDVTISEGRVDVGYKDGRVWRMRDATTVDTAGSYRLTGLTPGPHKLALRFDCFAKETYAEFESEVVPPRDDVVIRLEGGAIRVQVRNAGAPMPQVPVAVTGGRTSTKLTTAADGTATFFGVPGQSYHFMASPYGFTPSSVVAVAPAVDAPAVEPAALDVVAAAPTTTWTFRMSDDAGRPIHEAGLELFNANSKPPYTSTVLARDLTSTDGSFRLDGIPVGRWLAVVRPGGAWADVTGYFGVVTQIVNVSTDGTPDAELKTTPAGRLSVSAAGAPLDRFNCTVRDAAQAKVPVKFPTRRHASYVEQPSTVFGRADVQPALAPGKYVVEFDDLVGHKMSVQVEIRAGESTEASVDFDRR